MKKIIIILVFVSCSLTSLTQSHAVPFTLEDRDRIMRTEQEIKSLRNEMNTKFESQQRQISDLKTMFVWGFGILITLMLFTLGYVIWDRRTALNPVQKITINLKEKVKILESILKKEAESNIRLAEILRTYGLL